MKPIKLICRAPYHPFKQKWFVYHGFENEDKLYCSSCSYFKKINIMMFDVLILKPNISLYGEKEIILTRETAHALLDEAFDAKEIKEDKNGRTT